MQHKVEKEQPLLNEKGHLVEPGWSSKAVWQYNRNDIKVPWYRIKEWDYYAITGPDFALGFTISDIGYAGFYAFSLMLFDEGRHISSNPLSLFPRGKMGFPSSSREENQNLRARHKKFHLEYQVDGSERKIILNDPQFDGGKGIKGEILLHRDPEIDSLVIATPFPEDPRYFYYNEKTNNMPASGELQWGEKTLRITPDKYFAVLDWGRGVWPYKGTWYWSSGSGMADGHAFGFNLGYGFGNTEAATENMLFYDGKAHKLDQVLFTFDHDNVMKPWKFTSNDGRFEMDFVPLVDRDGKTNLGVIQTDQHQVFGKFTGTAVLDDGTRVNVKDYVGFAEKVFNQW